MTLLLLALAGCSQQGAAAKKASPKPKATFEWVETQLRVRGGPYGACSSFPCVLRFNVVRPLGGPRSLSIAVEEGVARFRVSWRGSSKSESEAKFPVTDELLGEVELASGKLRLSGPLRFEFEDLEPFEVDLPQLPFGASGVFFDVSTKLTFVDDADDPACTIYFVAGARNDLPSRIIGPGTLARDVDWVVRETRTQTGQKLCTGYRSSKGGGNVSVTAVAYDSKMTVLDRRTGEVVKEEVLKAGPPQCPNIAFGSGGVTEVPTAKITRWIDQLK